MVRRRPVWSRKLNAGARTPEGSIEPSNSLFAFALLWRDASVTASRATSAATTRVVSAINWRERTPARVAFGPG